MSAAPITRKAVGAGLALAGVAVAGLALLPERTLSAWILSLSYDREVEHMGFFVGAERGLVAALGLAMVLHAFPAVRRFWTLLLPKPPRTEALFGLTELRPAAFMRWAGLLALMHVPVLVALVWRHEWLHPLMGEDRIYEIAQAVAYFLAAGVMAWTAQGAIRRLRPFGVVHLLWVLMAAMTLAVALEEISYGQRIFHFASPGAMADLNQQREFNLHNIATGLTNRLFALGSISAAVFLPAGCLLSRRLNYLFRRLRIPLPTWPCLMTFAMGAVYTTPGVRSRIDEQALLCYGVIAVFCALAAVCLARTALRSQAPPLMAALALLILLRVVLLLFADNWPVGNYAEEGKEWFIALGFLHYSLIAARATLGGPPWPTRFVSVGRQCEIGNLPAGSLPAGGRPGFAAPRQVRNRPSPYSPFPSAAVASRGRSLWLVAPFVPVPSPPILTGVGDSSSGPISDRACPSFT